MISKKFALEQVRRLFQLDFYPKGDDVAILELVNAATAANTEALLKSTIDEFVSYSAACPKPAELRRMIFQKAEPEYRTRPTKCELCGDSGFMPMRVQVGDRVYDGATPCTCRSAQKATA